MFNNRRILSMILITGAFLTFHAATGRGESYDLRSVKGIDTFSGSAAADELFKLRGTEYDAGATRALAKIAPDRLAAELLKTALDKKIDSYLREQALVTLTDVSATNHIRELIPLLDDTTAIEYSRPMPGSEWRICDRTAETMATTLGWEDTRIRRPFVPPAERENLLTRAREWAKENSAPK